MYNHKNGINLRILEEYDCQLMKELKDESWFGTHRVTIKNQNQQIKWFNGIDNINNFFFVASCQDAIVGVYKATNCDWMSRQLDSGLDVFYKYRGKGYGKKILECGVDFCFEILNMNRLNAEILSNNIASKKCHEFCGFLEEGKKRDCIYKCGVYLDSYIYGLLRKDWENSERVKCYNGVCNFSYLPKNGGIS